MAREKICGIYCIKNLVDEKVYVGQSVNIYVRWTAHRWKLNNNRHNNLHLLHAWNKYGANNFEFSIIERCQKDELDQREIYWINKLNSRQHGYNMTDGGGGCLGMCFTDEQIKNKCYAILQLDFAGNIIERWDSANDASEALNICCRSIQSSAENNSPCKTAGGFIWVYEKDYHDFNIESRKDSKKSAVKQYSLEWEYIRTYSSMALAEQDGYKTSSVSAACRGAIRQAYGYIWTYDNVDIAEYMEWYNDYFDVYYIAQYNSQGKLIKIWNCAEDTKKDGFSPILVRANIRGKYKTHYGYIFKKISWRDYQILKGEINYGKQ